MKKFLIIAGGTALFWLFSIRPYNGRKDILRSVFKQKYIAHRGLFSDPDIPENSLAAFSNAVEHGYGIELDVQLSRDGKPVVFHDEDLLRMCGDPRKIRDVSFNELMDMRLGDTNEKIPSLKEVLAVVKGRVPLLIEIKPDGNFIKTTAETMKRLKNYRGKYCIESFQPLVLFWLKRHYPKVLRGQLSTHFSRNGDKHNVMIQYVLSNMMCNFFTRPDFIAYNHLFSDGLAFRICTKVYKSANAAWTIKNKKQLKSAKKDFEFFIFDSFIP